MNWKLHTALALGSTYFSSCLRFFICNWVNSNERQRQQKKCSWIVLATSIYYRNSNRFAIEMHGLMFVYLQKRWWNSHTEGLNQPIWICHINFRRTSAVFSSSFEFIVKIIVFLRCMPPQKKTSIQWQTPSDFQMNCCEHISCVNVHCDTCFQWSSLMHYLNFFWKC